MTTSVAVPAGLGYESLNWTLMRNKVRASSFLGKTSQEQARPGDYWKATVTFAKETGRDGLLLTKFLEEASKPGARIVLDAPQMRLGAWSTPELLTNTQLDTVSGWAAIGTGGVFEANARRFRITSGGVSYGAYQDRATTPGAHLIMADAVYNGSSVQWRLELREMPGNAVITTTNTAVDGRSIAHGVLTGSATDIRAAFRTSSGTSGSSLTWANPSAARCLLVAGASQTGTGLLVDGGPATTAAAILAGEFVTVEVSPGVSQLLRLVDDFTTDGSGAGRLRFEPALRASPADNAPVVVHKPFCATMVLSQGHAPVDIRSPMTYGTTVEFEEDLS